MKSTDSCRELFLDGVTDAYFYGVRDSSVPIPFSIPMLLNINGCHFAGEALHIALSEGNNYVISDSITAKETSSEGGNGTVFKFEITANISDGKANIPEIIKNYTENSKIIKTVRKHIAFCVFIFSFYNEKTYIQQKNQATCLKPGVKKNV